MDLNLSDDDDEMDLNHSQEADDNEEEMDSDGWEDGNQCVVDDEGDDASSSSSCHPPSSSSKRDLSHLNLPDSITVSSSSVLPPPTQPPNSTSSAPPPKKKRKQRRMPSKSLKSICSNAKKHPNLVRGAEQLHNAILLSHIASATFFSTTSSSRIPILMSLFPPLGLEVELDRLYDVSYNGETRSFNSRKNLSFIFSWFCNLFASNKTRSSKKGKAKLGAKRSLPRSYLSQITIASISSLFNVENFPQLSLPILLSSIFRLLHHRCRVAVSIPTPHPRDVTPLLMNESVFTILRGINKREIREVFASQGIDLSVKIKGASAADAIVLDDDDDDDGGGGGGDGSSGPTNPLPRKLLPAPPTSCWVEVYCAAETKWLHLDPLSGGFDQPEDVEIALKKEWNEHPGRGEVVKEARTSLPYVVAVEHGLEYDVGSGSITDVTRRYASSFATSKLLRNDPWLESTVFSLNGGDGMNSKEEENELKNKEKSEKAPTSKERFKNHPRFVLASQLKRDEVISPTASRRNGMFAGEFVYLRSDVSIARNSRKWLFEGRQVKVEELGKPVKEVVKRKIAASSAVPVSSQRKKVGGPSFGLSSYNLDIEGTKESMEAQKKLAEDDVAKENGGNAGKEMEGLYGKWQTVPWKPPRVNPGDPIPRNSYNNIELSLLNPGLVHLPIVGISRVAKKVGIDYAPCLVDFDYHSGRPVIRGIVVHECNKVVLEEAWGEMGAIMDEEHTKKVVERWRLLVTKVLLDKRLEEEWGSGEVQG